MEPILIVTVVVLLVLQVAAARVLAGLARSARAHHAEAESAIEQLRFELDAQADNLDREASARGGSDASLDMKCYLLADYLGMDWVRGKEGGWTLRKRMTP